MTEYWNKRYCEGNDSGEGSRGSYRKWKWKNIKRYVKVKNKDVLDVGCGDLQFLKGQKFQRYLGLDISPYIITKNQEKRPDLNFKIEDVTDPDLHLPRFNIVLCMDLLFHIMDEQDFVNLLENLNRWTNEWLFVINWSMNPMAPDITDGKYQYFRNLIHYLDKLPSLRLVDMKQKRGDLYNTLYVFKKRIVSRDEMDGVLGLLFTDEEKNLDRFLREGN